MIRFFKRLRFILNIKRFLPFLFEFFTLKEILIQRKLFPILLIVGYTLFPFDVIPDFLSVFGILDDITILTYILQKIVKMSPQHLKDKYGVIE